MGHKLLTDTDLAAALGQIHRKINRTALKIAAVTTGVLALGGVGGYLAVEGVRSKLEYTQRELQKAKQELAAAHERQANLEKVMAVSIDARRLGRPVRLSGEMIVVFAGKEGK